MALPRNREELRNRWANGERFNFYFFYGHKPPAQGVDESCLSQWFVRDFEINGVTYSTAEHWMMAEKARLFEDDTMLVEILDAAGPKEAKAFGRKVRNFDNEKWGEHKFEIVKVGNLAKFSQHEDLKAFLLGTSKLSHEQLQQVAENKEKYQLEYGGSAPSNEEVKENLGIYQIDSAKKNASLEKESKGNPKRNQYHVGSDETSSENKAILVEAAGRDTIWGIGLGKHNPKSLDPFKWRGLNLLGFVLTEVREELEQS